MVSLKKSIPDRVSKGSVSVPDRLAALNETQRHAVLATISNGKPYTSLVAFALANDGTGILFATPKASTKYKNIIKNKHVSLLIDTRSNTGKDYMKAESITIMGTARPVRKGKQWNELSNILISKHPALKDFVDAPGTALIMVRISRCVHVGRFQVVSVWEA